jgi:glycerophosphoryl diester phosphodiesterase
VKPIVIAHRGASGYRPEHTLAAYWLAVRQGADYIEPDLVATRDGVLVARHENEISSTTDVADHPEFARRHRRQTIDGTEVEGWFTEDFTFAELRSLRARERLPDLRPANTRWDGRCPIPTFEEVLALAERASRRVGRSIGVYPETKHPTHFRRMGLPLEEPLAAALAAHPGVPAFVQSFEASSLRRLQALIGSPLVQLVGGREAVDVADVARYADAIGVDKALVIPRSDEGRLAAPTALVTEAHAAGLAVHAWTFRAEPTFLPAGLDAAEEIDAFAAAGLDGIFTDHPDIAVRALSRVSRLGGS